MESPTLWTRLRASARGEISASTLEAYRRASLAVLELLDAVESARDGARAEGKTPWTMGQGEQSRMVCAWNAFVLQSLGTAFLDADYRDHPETKGFVPPITAEQVMTFFTPVEGWLGRAQRAASDPHYGLNMPLPAPLPEWSDVEPCPNSHLHGMLEAMKAIRDHASSAVAFLGDTPPTDEKQAKQYHAIRGLFASAEAKGRYSEDLHGVNPTQEVHELVEPTIKEAIEIFHQVGQLVGMPQFAPIDPPRAPVQAPPVVPQPRSGRKLPNEPGFDPWCLTDDEARSGLRNDPEARLAIERLWRYDPDPRATLRLLDEVEAAEARGDIAQAIGTNGRRLGHFFCCPWATVYETRRAMVLDGSRLGPYQQFVIDVTAEGAELGHPFRRGLKIGDFRPTEEFEYGDPNEAPDH